MDEKNTLTYDAWKEYLKNDKEMNAKWKSLIDLGENVKKNLKENLETLPYSEALKRRKFLTAKNIFNIINTAKEKPNFNWGQKLIYNEDDEHYEYVIQCIDPASDYIFRKIKLERGVANMHGESIDKYLKPISEKIWALKAALRVSIQTETKPSDLSYDAMKIDIYDEKEVDPDYPKDPEGWSGPTDARVEGPSFSINEDEKNQKKDIKEEVNKENVGEEDINGEEVDLLKKGPKMDENGQYLIDFPD